MLGTAALPGATAAARTSSNPAVERVLQWDRWTSIPGPPPLAGASAALDADDGDVIVFGGRTSNGSLSNDTWVWNGKVWNRLTASQTIAPPAPRDGGDGIRPLPSPAHPLRGRGRRGASARRHVGMERVLLVRACGPGTGSTRIGALHSTRWATSCCSGASAIPTLGLLESSLRGLRPPPPRRAGRLRSPTPGPGLLPGGSSRPLRDLQRALAQRSASTRSTAAQSSSVVRRGLR